MLLSQPSWAEAISLGTIIHRYIHISYQVIVAGGHLLEEFQAAVTV